VSKKLSIVIVVTLLPLILWRLYAPQESEVSYIRDDAIVLGQSCALSGQAGELGKELRNGALAYFNHINAQGGVHGREIKLITYDDMYEPNRAVANTQKLIDEEKVFALFGEVGTPTSKAVLPIVQDADIPFLTPFTGAEFLRNPHKKNVINLRNSYYAETEALVAFLSKKGITDIAVFYQNDSYGKAGYEGVKRALAKRNLPIYSEGRYRRNTLSYQGALNIIQRSYPEAIILIGAYKPSAEFIKAAKDRGANGIYFCNISFVGSSALIKELDGRHMDLVNDRSDVIISQVVPSPWHGDQPSVKEYRSIYKKEFPQSDYSFVSLEGFLNAKLVVAALQKSGRELTRANFMQAFETLDSGVLDGFEISLSPGDHQALGSVYISEYKEGQFTILDVIQ
jgi:ABC-type branched-subunit amino acid transport system substrate-binding protein